MQNIASCQHYKTIQGLTKKGLRLTKSNKNIGFIYAYKYIHYIYNGLANCYQDFMEIFKIRPLNHMEYALNFTLRPL